ncbi:MAG TPA: serine hydrolase [Bacteroidales bacterium]|nr:serine hydrolase [Bacteroidales bacterium]
MYKKFSNNRQILLTNFKSIFWAFKVFVVFLLSISATYAQQLPNVSPESVGMSSTHLKYTDEFIEKAISDKEIPGAVLAVVKDGKMAYLKAYGNKEVYPNTVKMDVNTVFDLASVTKSIATATSAMILIERGQLRLQDKVSLFIPNFQGWKTADGKTIDIRVVDLLTHTSGLPAYASVDMLEKQFGAPNPDALINHIATCKRDFEPQTNMQYSCLNFITLQRIIETISKQSLQEFAKKNIFDVLGMTHTDFMPKGETLARVAPTERQKDGSVIRGIVHDPLARVMNGGISGNAGLFSDANDLAVFAAALQNGGEYNGKRILSPLTVQTMRSVPRHVAQFGRTLGWDVFSPYASNSGDLLSPNTYGHTGYTGTSIVIDPDNQLSIILLTNRVHPDDHGSVVRLRSLVANAVAGAVFVTDNQQSSKQVSETPKRKYSDHYYRRMELFAKETHITPNDVVMLGNSITECGNDWNLLLGTTNVRNRGISGDIAEGLVSRMGSIVSGRPQKLFILIGINDISKGIPNDTIVENIEKIVKEFKEKSPKTKIYLQSIMPFDQSKRGQNKRLENKTQTVIDANKLIKELAKKHHVTFIDLYPHLVEKNTNVLKDSYTYDGLHLNESGYKVWVKILKKYL